MGDQWDVWLKPQRGETKRYAAPRLISFEMRLPMAHAMGYRSFAAPRLTSLTLEARAARNGDTDYRGIAAEL